MHIPFPRSKHLIHLVCPQDPEAPFRFSFLLFSSTQRCDLPLLLCDHICCGLRRLIHVLLGPLHFCATFSSNFLCRIVVVVDLFSCMIRTTSLGHDYFLDLLLRLLQDIFLRFLRSQVLPASPWLLYHSLLNGFVFSRLSYFFDPASSLSSLLALRTVFVWDPVLLMFVFFSRVSSIAKHSCLHFTNCRFSSSREQEDVY